MPLRNKRCTTSIPAAPITAAYTAIDVTAPSHRGMLLKRATAKTAFSARRCREIMRVMDPVRDIEITIVVAAIICAVAFFATS